VKVTAVIGANFGDEGKGLLTDYLCAGHPRSLVIRYNGGAQAGHTVVTPEGHRHVFSHIGSGALVGADTYLSQFFIVNPLLWAREFKELKGKTQNIFIHPDALLSTPYDMLFNRALEKSRGSNRHGSCGLGINETVRRCEGLYRTTVDDMSYVSNLAGVKDYFVDRAKIYGIDLDSIPEWNSLTLWKDFLFQCKELSEQYELKILEKEIKTKYNNIVFEGAQGLLLDQDNFEYAPFITSTKTGITNVEILCKEMGLGNDLEAIYVTRSYMTRHGPGPLPLEDKTLLFFDQTNRFNNWQRKLRFGRLDFQSLCERVAKDAKLMNLKPSLAITCLDQHPCGPVPTDEFKNLYCSYGPTRNHVRNL